MFHVCLWQFLPMDDSVWPPGIAAWAKVNSYLGSLRMPLLLAISGMLAARRIREGWGRPGAAIRAASSYYLYVVWLVIYFAFYLSVSGAVLPHRIGSVGGFLGELFVPETPLWYIFALALYVVVLTSVRRVPPAVVLGVLALISIVALAAYTGGGLFEKVPENAVFFAIGVYGGQRLQTFTAKRRLRDLLIWSAAGLLTVIAAKWSYGAVVDAVLHVVRGSVFLVLGASVVINLIRWRPLGRLGEYVGRRTLQIYVLHAPLIMVVMAVVNQDRIAGLRPILQVPVVGVLWPIALSVGVVAASLLIHRLLILARLKALFDMPPVVARLIHRAYRQPSGPSGVDLDATAPDLAETIAEKAQGAPELAAEKS